MPYVIEGLYYASKEEATNVRALKDRSIKLIVGSDTSWSVANTKEWPKIKQNDVTKHIKVLDIPIENDLIHDAMSFQDGTEVSKLLKRLDEEIGKGDGNVVIVYHGRKPFLLIIAFLIKHRGCSFYQAIAIMATVYRIQPEGDYFKFTDDECAELMAITTDQQSKIDEKYRKQAEKRYPNESIFLPTKFYESGGPISNGKTRMFYQEGPLIQAFELNRSYLNVEKLVYHFLKDVLDDCPEGITKQVTICPDKWPQ